MKTKQTTARLLVKFGSHRARKRGLALLSRVPQGYWSMSRATGKGVYEVTAGELALLRSSQIKGITEFRDGDDLGKTLKWR